MIWLWVALLGLVAVCLGPLMLAMGGGFRARGRSEAALALHRAQLAEIDRDLADGRLGAAEHAQAKLEVQRRLLAEAERGDAAPARASRGPLLAVLAIVPVGAVCLYLTGGHPELPAQPLGPRIARAEARAQEEQRLIDALRQHLAKVDPHSAQGRQGYVLLGNVEQSRGNFAAAATAWKTALDAQFDPTLAAETAEATARAEGKVGPDAAALFRQALAAAPEDAPWRKLAEERLAEAGH